MSAKPNQNKFAAALKKPAAAAPAPQTVPEPEESEVVAAAKKAPLKHPRRSRATTKFVGGHFDPTVSKQLRVMAADEDTTIQDLVAEALDMLFQSRQQPTIASRKKEG